MLENIGNAVTRVWTNWDERNLGGRNRMQSTAKLFRWYWSLLLTAQ